MYTSLKNNPHQYAINATHPNTTDNQPYHPRMHSLNKPEKYVNKGRPETKPGRQPRGHREHNKLPQRSGSIPPHLNHKFEHNYTKIKAKKSRPLKESEQLG
uniref:Uncharacterized protein n=1 Tax=Cacopsylla melanoneura TaxID=428564 RepID=A0A8D8PMX7_9HEMI